MSGPGGALNVVSTVSGTSYAGIIGDSSITAPSWSLAQWNNPQPITGSIRSGNDIDWTVASGSNAATNALTVTHSAAYDAYVLSQNIQTHNSNYPNYISCQSEADAFLQSNGYYNIYNTNTPAPLLFDTSKPVGRLSVLNGYVNMAIDSETVSTQYCGISYVGYGFNITLNNTVNGQSMFYQISIRDSRGARGGQIGCPNYPRGNPSQFCFFSSIGYLFGIAQPTPGQSAMVYNMNLLPGLIALIHQGYYGMDTNTNDWVVTSIYVGQGGNGDMSATSVWNEISLSAW